jgi:hypothetical protein
LGLCPIPFLSILLGVGLACPKSLGSTTCMEAKPAGVDGVRQRCGGTGVDIQSSGTSAGRGSEPGQGILSPVEGLVLGLGRKS